jgi:alpha-L-rhamnosidase
MKKHGLLLLLLLPWLAVSAQNLTVGNLTCSYKTNPVGIDVTEPQLAWKLVSTGRNVMQTAYEIRVALSNKDIADAKNLVWSSGKVNSDESAHVNYTGPKLLSRQRYYWQVRVWDDHKNASPWSAVNYWEMGLLAPADWSAKWIQTAKTTDGKVGPAPMFANNFNVIKPVKQARLYITSHGLYEARLNGTRVGQYYFTPGWTSYNKRLQYQTYDVTAALKQGKNAALVTVGDGWYRGNLEFKFKRNVYGKEAGLLFQLEITYGDGTKETIASDGNWKSSMNGPVRLSDIYNGETYDARLEGEAMAQTFTGNNWQGVTVTNSGYDNLVAPLGPPVVKHERFHPLKFIKTPKGETVVDFGQNLVGWVQLKLKGKAGDTRKAVNHAEVLDQTRVTFTLKI